MTVPGPAEIAAAVRRYLLDAVTTETERARVVLDVVRQFYDFTKFHAPGGDGLDGRDGAERDELSELVEAAEKHRLAAFQREHPEIL